MLVPPSRALFDNHEHKSTFDLLLRHIWPVVDQSIRQFSGFVPFGMGYDGSNVIPFQWPIHKPMPTFGLIEWVADQQFNYFPALDAAALTFAVQIKDAVPLNHTVIVLQARESSPIKIFVPYDSSLNDSWWCEPSDRSLL